MSANDLVLGTHELPRRAGEMKKTRREIDAPADLGVEMIGVPEGSPIALDLVLQSAGEGILVTGTATARLLGSCVRCLASVAYDDSFTIDELYFYPGREAEEDDLYVVDEQIDLDPALREAVVLELPINPLCRPDCLGLCPICGRNRNDDPRHSHEDAPTDARWEALKALNLD
ncbi:MAG: DUF177 domain-containing protein [Propionibacteriaceae bacterium]|jgi:uncharacterized protein|nr:DUF177 domain-containing protein [Propionibacteriaceae bacterium]